MRFNTLNEWLNWQQSLNPKEIDLGLGRVRQVLAQASLPTSFDCPLITVAGTNGKGSVVAILETLAIAAGLKICCYTSPHIFHYNERIKINGQPIADDRLCEAFERIDQARGEQQLTYFEFATLAAIDLFYKEQPDLVVLEVGLGGRLDAVNIMDADVSILTSVAIDHVEWLGDNRESIGFEKAGVFRRDKPVICGDKKPPNSVVVQAEKKNCEFLLAGSAFDVIAAEISSADANTGHWALKSSYGDIPNLPAPNIVGEFQKLNAASAMLALQVLQVKTTLAPAFDLATVAATALKNIKLNGRFQQVNTQPSVYVDVAHNPQAALALSSQLKASAAGKDDGNGKTWALVAMLADKDIAGVLGNVSADIDCWCFSGLQEAERGLSVEVLYERLPAEIFAGEKPVMSLENQHELDLNQCTMLSETVHLMPDVTTACAGLLSQLKANDRLIIFGSFYTVAAAMRYFSERNLNN